MKTTGQKTLGLFYHSPIRFAHSLIQTDSHNQTFLHHFFCHSHTYPSFLLSLSFTLPLLLLLTHSDTFLHNTLPHTSSFLILSLGFSCFPIFPLYSFSNSHSHLIIPHFSFSHCLHLIPIISFFLFLQLYQRTYFSSIYSSKKNVSLSLFTISGK